MANILWPEDLCPTTFSMPLRVDMRAHSATFGGSERVIDMLDDVWMAELSIDIRQGVAAGRLEGLVNWLNGGRDTASLWHFARPVPNGTLRGSPVLLNPAGKGVAELVLGAVAGQTLRAGDMLGIGGLLVQVAADCVADASGVITVPLVNRLRRAVAGLSRASTATYIDSGGVLRTAFVDEPRFQGGSVLVEGAGTNTLLRSGTMESSWVRGTEATWTNNADVAPDGTMAALRVDNLNSIAFSTGGGALYQTSRPVVSGQPYVFSVWVKGAPENAGQINLRVFEVGGASFIGPSISITSGEWTRVSFGRIAPESVSLVSVVVGKSNATPPVSCYLWGAQLETGPTATSYIPTTTAPATRAADVVTPVVWDRPTGIFRLQNLSTLGHGTAYSDTVTMSFEENIYG